jgi:hypothetical protein
LIQNLYFICDLRFRIKVIDKNLIVFSILNSTMEFGIGYEHRKHVSRCLDRGTKTTIGDERNLSLLQMSRTHPLAEKICNLLHDDLLRVVSGEPPLTFSQYRCAAVVLKVKRLSLVNVD